jgi:phage-related minor tail protein
MSDEVVETTEEPAENEQKPEFTAEEIAKYKELRKEAATRRKENEALAKELAELKAAQEEQANAELMEQGKYKDLADKANNRVKELESVAEQNERLIGVIDNLLTTQKDGLPESITRLLDKLDPVEQLEWLAENKATVTQPEPETEQEPGTAQPQKQPALTPFNPNSGQVKENDAQRLSRLYSQTMGNTPFG